MLTAATRTVDDRSEPRQDVLHRSRVVGADGVDRVATVVNLSPHGFMARCDDGHVAGDRIFVTLPRIGQVRAEVRWALGGRIGCRLERAIGMADYHALLQAVLRG